MCQQGLLKHWAMAESCALRIFAQSCERASHRPIVSYVRGADSWADHGGGPSVCRPPVSQQISRNVP
eukprot:5107649-Pleurochrysis_carterae.AAC.1